MTALRDLAGLMDGLWTRVPQSARGLVGKSISYHGNDLEVADVQGDALVLRKGPGPSGPPFKVPFRGLALNDLLPLLLNEMNPRTPDYHVRAAAFWLWHWRPMVYTSARDQAGKLGADTRTLDAAFALLQQAHNEADAKKPWDAAQQAIAKGQWRLAEKNLTELMQNFGESLLVKERSESLRYLRALALRDGRPLVLLGQRRDLGDGLIELTYDFRQPESLRDWIVSSRWVHAGRGLDICRTNWLTHAARFQEIVEWRCEVRGLTQSNKENAFWGWLIGAEAMPETLSATAFPGALCGRISAVAGTPGGLWGPSEQALGLSERTTIGERMSCVSVFSLEPGLARWTINGSEFLVAKDPDLPRTRNLVLLNPGLSVRLRSVSLRGRLLPAWEEQAQTASDRSYDLAQGVRNALADRRSAPILQDMNWLAESQRVWWSVVGDELRFQGAPGAPPLTLPVGVRDATWSGRFRYGRSRDAGCRLGFRLSGSTGYYVDLLADRRVILASKMTAATDGGSEPLKLTSLREKTDVQFVPETWHSFEIRFVDDEIEVRLDGEAQFTVKDSSFDAGDLSLSGVSDDGRSPPVSFKQLELRPPQ
jgi:hypothetical protein